MSNIRLGVERETWGEMGARDRGGSDTSWCVDRYELMRACSAVSFCHPSLSSSVCPSDRSDRSIGSDRIDRIGLDEARPCPFPAPSSSSPRLAPLSHTRAGAAAAAAAAAVVTPAVIVGGHVAIAIATPRRRGSLVHARARVRALAAPSLRPSHNAEPSVAALGIVV